jgi:hypothetical protein
LPFVTEQTEAINALGLLSGEVPPLFCECFCVLRTLLLLLTQLKSSKTPLTRGYPLIVGCIEELGRYAAHAQQRGMTKDHAIIVIYKSVGQMIRRFTLDSTYNLLGFAHVLSPHGSATVKLRLRQPAAFARDDEQVVNDTSFSLISSRSEQIMRMAKLMKQATTKGKSPSQSKGRIELKALRWTIPS